MKNNKEINNIIKESMVDNVCLIHYYVEYNKIYRIERVAMSLLNEDKQISIESMDAISKETKFVCWANDIDEVNKIFNI